MEPHLGKPTNFSLEVDPREVGVEELFKVASLYVDEYHKGTLEWFRYLKLEDLTSDNFWREYIWTVYTSGFKASIVTKKFPDLMEAYGPYHKFDFDCNIWERVRPILANKRKCDAILACRRKLKVSGWSAFRKEYCQSPSTLKNLPFIGGITCYHLARNLGMDAVKPDLHLVRLSNHYKFNSPEAMCYFLAGLYRERIGVIDFTLWAYCAAFGTNELVS